MLERGVSGPDDPQYGILPPIDPVRAVRVIVRNVRECYTVLGIVHKKGPCSGYSVLQEFAGAKSDYYRSGAGSIYPLLKRLIKVGLLESGADKRLSITPEGVAALREWFFPDEASCSLDSIRSRLYFLAVLGLAAGSAVAAGDHC